MATSNIFSEKTKTAPIAGELSTTATDMTQLFAWEYGDPEPTGTHAKNYAPHRRLRRDLKRGARAAKVYNQNYILVDTFKIVSKQLVNL